MLNLPQDILEVLRQGKIAYTKAKAMASLKEEEARNQLLWQAIDENLSLVAIREKIAQLKRNTHTTSTTPTPNVKIQNISRRLNQAKLWKEDPQQWKKVQNYLDQIEALLTEAENTINTMHK